MSRSLRGIFVLFGVIFLQANVFVKGHGPWQGWGRCTKLCGGGERWRIRHCSSPLLQYECYQTQSCNSHPCHGVRHGGWSNWGSWGRCTYRCRGGIQLRSRKCNRPAPANGGRYCKGSSTQAKKCGKGSCRCKGRRYVYNKCGERCRCLWGFMFHCTRIRKEFTSMTYFERKRYINVIKIASTHPSYKSQYDDLITLHMTYFGSGIHLTPQFLPWHRWYILQYENLLRQIDCRFTVAYWDWASVAGSPFETTSNDLWYSGNSGFGGNGSPPGGCVNTGPFKFPNWQLVPSATPPLCLKRNFNGNPPGEVELTLLLDIPPTPQSSFLEFEGLLRGQFHDNVHCLINGTMCTHDAASAPEFFLHHGMIDKIWEDWQKQSSTHRTVYFSNITSGMTATGGVLPSAVLHNLALPGGIRVMYKEKKDPGLLRISKKLKSMSKSQLQNIARAGFTPLSQEAIKLFRWKNSEAKRVMKMSQKLLRPRARRRLSSRASALDRKLGFSAKKVEAT